MINCIIVEDQPPAQRILKHYINQFEFFRLNAIFPDAVAAKKYIEKEKVDIIFLDINLPKISGIDFLKSTSNSPYIILTTAYADYALESYEYNVIDYLLKPFSYERFVQSIEKLTKLIGQIEDTLFFKSGYDFVKISSKDVLYIKSDADYTEIITDEKKYLSSHSLKHWLTELSEFYGQIHKSYIINVTKIKKISGNKALLIDNIELPIGRAFKQSLIEKCKKVLKDPG